MRQNDTRNALRAMRNIDQSNDPGSLVPARPRPRPSKWPVDKADFGPQHDYTLQNLGRFTAIHAVSEAALQWCYRYLPADIDRVEVRGFKVETRYLLLIITLMQQHGLMNDAQWHDDSCALDDLLNSQQAIEEL